MEMIYWFIFSFPAGDLCVVTLYLLCVGPVSVEFLAAAETNSHRETGKTRGGQCWPFRCLCGGSEEEG